MDNHCVVCGAYLADTGRMICEKCEKPNKAKLKPCPFCGGEAELYRMKRDSRKRYGVYHMIATIKCRECTAQVSQAGWDEERAIENAAKMWNRRAEDGTNDS